MVMVKFAHTLESFYLPLTKEKGKLRGTLLVVSGEAGENPARCRHCKREVTLPECHCGPKVHGKA